MERWYLIGGVAGAVGLVTATVTGLFAARRFGYIRRIPLVGPDPDHLVEVRNEREQAHDVAVDVDVGGEGMTHGPWRIKSGEHWGVRRIHSPSEVTLTVTVDGEETLTEHHEAPVSETGSSAVVVSLRESGFVTARVEDPEPEDER